VKNVYIVDIV